MTDTEGVIKFDLRYRPSSVEPSNALDELLIWRDVFFRLGVIGQDPARYGGCAFGNISCRLGTANQFVISGSQTGRLEQCTAEHFSVVDVCDVENNRVDAHGPIAPSSESLTHGAIYSLDEHIRYVVHGHAPKLWCNIDSLGIAATDRNVEYGTPAMAREIKRLYLREGKPPRAMFAMLGHEDGIIAYGDGFAGIETIWKSVAQRAEVIQSWS